MKRYRGKHRKEPYGRTIGQITVEQLKHREIWEGYDTPWWPHVFPQKLIVGLAERREAL